MTKKNILLGAVLLLSSVAQAEEATQAAAAAVGMGGWIAVATGFGIALAAFGGAFGQGRAAAAALEGVARNPQAADKMFLPLILSLALIESLVIYALVISFQLNGQLSKLIGG